MITWHEKKRLRNIDQHGLDFIGCDAIWDRFTVTREDLRRQYGEQRFVVFGRLNRLTVVLVYTERRRGPHVISLRRAAKYEARYYAEEAREFQGEVTGLR